MLRLYPGLGGFGGGLAPAAQGDIIQWLVGGTSDGESLDYAVQTVASGAELRNVAAYDFDGVADKIRHENISGGDRVTVFYEGVIEASPSGTRALITRGTAVSSIALYDWALYTTPTLLRFIVSDGVGADIVSVAIGGVDDGAVHEVVGVCGASEVSIYVDGVKTAITRTRTMQAASDEAHVHQWGTSGGTYAGGQAVQYAVINEEIPQATIEAGWAPRDSECALHCECEEGGDSNLSYDISGNNRHGLITFGAGGASTLHSTLSDISSTNAQYGFRKVSSPSDIDVIILAGQSNMEAHSEENPPTSIPKYQDHLYTWDINKATDTTDLSRLQEAFSQRWSVELKAGVDITTGGRSVCFIKVALGATNLSQDWQKAGGGAGMYEAMDAQVSATLTNLTNAGYSPTVREFWWLQGEADADDLTMANNYVSNFNQMWSDATTVDNIFPATTRPVFAYIQGEGTYTYRSTVNNAFDTLATTYSTEVIDTKTGYPTRDNVHYTGASLINLGTEFAASYLGEGYTAQTGEDIVYSRVPSLTDGSAAADGNPITNSAGFVHNESECDVAQTDAAVFGAGTVSFWSADGSALDEKTKAQLDSHYNNTNGSYNLWLRYGDDNTVESIQYALNKEFTPAEVLQNEAYFGGTSGALRDVDGELITDVDGYVIFHA